MDMNADQLLKHLLDELEQDIDSNLYENHVEDKKKQRPSKKKLKLDQILRHSKKLHILLQNELFHTTIINHQSDITDESFIPNFKNSLSNFVSIIETCIKSRKASL